MNEQMIKDQLDKALEDFRASTEFNYETATSKNCTQDDLKELGKQTFYALSYFRDVIIKMSKN